MLQKKFQIRLGKCLISYHGRFPAIFMWHFPRNHSSNSWCDQYFTSMICPLSERVTNPWGLMLWFPTSSGSQNVHSYLLFPQSFWHLGIPPSSSSASLFDFLLLRIPYATSAFTQQRTKMTTKINTSFITELFGSPLLWTTGIAVVAFSTTDAFHVFNVVTGVDSSSNTGSWNISIFLWLFRNQDKSLSNPDCKSFSIMLFFCCC
mgnify:CR=1 FL=1